MLEAIAPRGSLCELLHSRNSLLNHQTMSSLELALICSAKIADEFIMKALLRLDSLLV